jgi:RNA polymerase sigma factor (TIGR02999 family)
VHEVYLRFADRSSPNLLDRDHFVALAASAMRMVIVDHWRRKHSRKRDRQAPISVNLDDVAAPSGQPNFDVLALDQALRSLSELDARQAQVVELRFFGGLTLDEIATMLGVSERTVKREWQKARTFLYHAMRSPGDEDDA